MVTARLTPYATRFASACTSRRFASAGVARPPGTAAAARSSSPPHASSTVSPAAPPIRSCASCRSEIGSSNCT